MSTVGSIKVSPCKETRCIQTLLRNVGAAHTKLFNTYALSKFLKRRWLTGKREIPFGLVSLLTFGARDVACRIVELIAVLMLSVM